MLLVASCLNRTASLLVSLRILSKLAKSNCELFRFLKHTPRDFVILCTTCAKEMEMRLLLSTGPRIN